MPGKSAGFDRYRVGSRFDEVEHVDAGAVGWLGRDDARVDVGKGYLGPGEYRPGLVCNQSANLAADGLGHRRHAEQTREQAHQRIR